MAVLCDTQIRELIDIKPFEAGERRPGRISYGVSSYGYDVRVGARFKVFTPTPRHGGVAVVDPKKFNDDFMVDIDTAALGTDHIVIPPNSFALAETVETFAVPREVLVICVGKSTYARCGLIVNVTPLEPEWRGKVTLEISNTTPLPAKVYANEGIAQMIFLKGDRVCAVSYADKAGKYQDQVGLTLPRVD
jgi:dCTP deaminase